MLGVILCGGQSTRMGKDKGTIHSHSVTWAKLAADKFSALSLRVVLSVNARQYTDYSHTFKDTLLIKDSIEIAVKGPLAGILSVHTTYPEDDLFVLACDMPLMDTRMLEKLLAIYRDQPTAPGYVYLNTHEPEPLCAIYAAKGLAYILHLINEEQLTKYSMKFVLEQLQPITTRLAEDEKKYFLNINTPCELGGLQS